MRPAQFSGSYPLFKLWGIRVFIHWSWFLAAAYLVQQRSWKLGESGNTALLHVISLFAIVLMHEFGHALACRSVGGEARTIVLWPLGGVAFVKPPPRPGPVLWSIAAGPLVNVALIPFTVLLLVYAQVNPLDNLHHWATSIFLVNLLLLIFNMLPVYPLDGGQILQALLWFWVGRAKSLRITAVIGIIAAVAGGVFALLSGLWWLVLMATFLAWQAYNGLRYARQLSVIEQYEQARSA